MTTAAPLTVAAAFERTVRWFADADAVVDSGTRLTFQALEDRSARAASVLAKHGARPGVPVAILAAPSAAYLVAWLGVVRLGAIPAVLHVRESATALARACERIAPGLLVYDAALEGLATRTAGTAASIRTTIRFRSALAPEPDGLARPVADFSEDLDGADTGFPQHSANEDDPAVIVLSSGTTSVAKGVVHTNRSLVEMARTDLYLCGGIRPSDRSVVPLSTAFIGCYNGWLPFLNAGACTIFMERFDIERLARLVAAERASHVFLTPTLWRRFLNADIADLDFRSVRQIGFAAEIMDQATLERLRERISPDIVQMYGSTETGAAATCNFADDMIGPRLVSVGRPMPNGDIRVVTPGGGPADEVSPGETGEILVTSPSLATGIWNDPAATEASFVSDGTRRWWRSRDLGRIDRGGFLFIEGRHDDMIISAGINVMPALVEDALLKHPSVRECAVIGVPHPDLGEQIVAFVVAADPTLDAAALDRHLLASELSPYQRPRSYTFVNELPRTPTNKVSRKVLREEAIAAPTRQTRTPDST
jgi:fatty-acyl-CoA synthase